MLHATDACKCLSRRLNWGCWMVQTDNLMLLLCVGYRLFSFEVVIRCILYVWQDLWTVLKSRGSFIQQYLPPSNLLPFPVPHTSLTPLGIPRGWPCFPEQIVQTMQQTADLTDHDSTVAHLVFTPLISRLITSSAESRSQYGHLCT